MRIRLPPGLRLPGRPRPPVPEELVEPETQPVEPVVHLLQYTAKDGKSKFRFELYDYGKNWRIYIRSQPSYGGRSTEAHVVHRLCDRRGSYICWRGTISTYDEAATVARMWAEGTANYIASCARF